MEYTSDEHIIYGYKRKWQCNINIVNKQIRARDWDGFKETPLYRSMYEDEGERYVYEFYKGSYYYDTGNKMNFKRTGLCLLNRLPNYEPFHYNRTHIICKGFDGKFKFHPCV